MENVNEYHGDHESRTCVETNGVSESGAHQRPLDSRDVKSHGER